MENSIFHPGDIVRHFKRERLTEGEKRTNRYLYQIVGPAVHSETREPMVVYRALYGEYGLWVRPAAMWNETVDRDGYHGPRFQYIGDKLPENG